MLGMGYSHLAAYVQIGQSGRVLIWIFASLTKPSYVNIKAPHIAT